MSERPSRVVVIVDHGSRRPGSGGFLEEIASRLGARLVAGDLPIALRIAHLELAAPLLPDVLDACAGEGFHEVLVHPFLLGAGRHLEVDVPEALQAARSRHPEVSFRMTRALGESPELVDAVLARIRESLEAESA